MSPPSDASYPVDVRAALLGAAHDELLENGVGGLSLRAIAARAGVSRATPKWHFGDRAGLLTGLAVEGFDRLGRALRTAVRDIDDPAARFTALGRAYLDFGLDNADLFELMFRSDELRRDDPELGRARGESFAVLVDTAAATTGPAGDGQSRTGNARPAPDGADIPLLAWACAHGLVVLVQGGALGAFTGLPGRDESAALAHRLADTFTALVPR